MVPIQVLRFTGNGYYAFSTSEFAYKARVDVSPPGEMFCTSESVL